MSDGRDGRDERVLVEGMGTIHVPDPICEDAAPPAWVRAEPCPAHEGPEQDGICARCGWLAEEHESLAEVVAVPLRRSAFLRRAS